MILYRSASAPSLRAFPPRAEGGVEGMPTMHGYFSVFNQWTEIDSTFEGNFMERVAPGAFSRSLAYDRARLRVLFNHGRDPTFGDKVLGIPSVLREDEQGGAYEVPLLDTSYNRDLIPGLQAGAYGSSFRFKVVRENLDNTAPVSSYNPKGLPERTITEAKVMELGPVTFPAYQGATAGVRSLTDWFVEQAVAA
jgi:HK97 family phage prohead protease